MRIAEHHVCVSRSNFYGHDCTIGGFEVVVGLDGRVYKASVLKSSRRQTGYKTLPTNEPKLKLANC